MHPPGPRRPSLVAHGVWRVGIASAITAGGGWWGPQLAHPPLSGRTNPLDVAAPVTPPSRRQSLKPWQRVGMPVPGFHHLGPILDLLPYGHDRVMKTLLKGDGVLIDVGGGTGRVSRRFMHRWRRTIVVDPERALLLRARRKGLACIVADACHLPFKQGVIDGVLVTDALHHIRDAEGTFGELARVIAPARGVIVVEEFDPSSFGGMAVIALERLLRFGSRFFEPRELVGIARAAGLEARIERLSRRDYAVVARLRKGSGGGGDAGRDGHGGAPGR